MKHSGAKEEELACMAWPCRPWHHHAEPPPLSLACQPWPPRHSTPPHCLASPSTALVEDELDRRRNTRAQWWPRHAEDVASERRGRALDTRCLATSSTPWTTSLRVEHHRTRTKPPDTLSTATRAHRRRRRRRNPAAATARQGNNRPR